MSNSYYNKMRRQFRESGLTYDESDFPSRRENILTIAIAVFLIAGFLGLFFYLDIGPHQPDPPVEAPAQNPQRQTVGAIMGLMLLSPLLYLMFLGMKSLARHGAARITVTSWFRPSRSTTTPAPDDLHGDSVESSNDESRNGP